MAETNLYALIETRPEHPNLGLPFYIGIGTVKRPRTHLLQARSGRGHRNWRLQEVLAAHFLLGTEPEIRVLHTFPDKVAAGAAEVEAIARYGRTGIDDGGILTNLAIGGQGPDADLMRMPEVRKRNADAQRNRSDESKAASLAGLRKAHADPEIQARKAANSREPQRLSWTKPEVRSLRVALMLGKKKALTPESLAARRMNATLAHIGAARETHRLAILAVWQRPDHRAKRSINQTAAWTDPQKRANMLEGRSDGIAASWQDPETRTARTTAISSAVADKWANDPDYAARARAGLQAAWDDPEKKAARVAKMLETRARKRAERGEPAPKSAGRSACMTRLNATLSAEDRSTMQTKTWANPDIAAKRRAGIQAAAQDPALKAARIANMLAGKRRKAAERAAMSGGAGHGGA